MPTGEIQPEFVTRLKEVGQWLERNGESIYGTRPAYIGYLYNTACTTHGNKLYFHVFNWQLGASLRVDLELTKPVKRAYVLEDGQPIEYIRNPSLGEGLSGGLSFVARNRGWNSPNTVIVIETES
jgi:alpha-L-fucosidase